MAGAEGSLSNTGASLTSFRVLCGTELFETTLSDGLRERLQTTYFAAALEESPSASMMKWDAERGAVVVDGVDAADFRLIWDYLVRGRAPLLDSLEAYDRFLAAADYLCVRGFR